MRNTYHLVILCLAAIISLPAWSDYQSEHQLYTEALNAGDAVGAIRHAENAWRVAETELGENATTATLAINYAELIIAFFPERAIEPYERAFEMAQNGVGPLDASHVELMLVGTRLGIDLENRKLARNVKKLLKDNPQLLSSVAAIHAWKSLARHELLREQYFSAQKYADQAVAAASSFNPPVPRVLSTSLILAATARTSDPELKKRDMIDATALLDRAYPLFPAQTELDQFDPLLSQTIVLHGVVNAIAETNNWRSLVESAADSEVSRTVLWQTEKPDYCSDAIKWTKKRTSPVFPDDALDRQFIGAALVGYDLGDEGVERVVVLADNRAVFGDAAAKTVSEWKLAAPPPQECRKNHLMRFQFGLNCRKEFETISNRQGGQYEFTTECTPH